MHTTTIAVVCIILYTIAYVRVNSLFTFTFTTAIADVYIILYAIAYISIYIYILSVAGAMGMII